MSFDAKRMSELLPAIYRIRDADRGEPLKALLLVIADQVGVLEEDLAQLYDDQFIETCAPLGGAVHWRSDWLSRATQGRAKGRKPTRGGGAYDWLPPPQRNRGDARAACPRCYRLECARRGIFSTPRLDAMDTKSHSSKEFLCA